MNKLSENRIILFSAVLIIFVCFFAVYLRLFTEKELWYEMFAAVLGVIITAIITMILLKGQSENEGRREKNTKVFEEKLKIYQDYLHTLCDVIKGHSLSDEEKILLEFQTSYVAMHCDSKYIATVSKAVQNLIEYYCPDDDEGLTQKDKSGSPDPLLDNLFCIVEAFRKDLYGDNFKFEDEHKQKTLKNFSDAYFNARNSDYNMPQATQHMIVDLNVLSNSLQNEIDIENIQSTSEDRLEMQDAGKQSESIENIDLWNNALAQWEKEGWNVNDVSGEYNVFHIAKGKSIIGIGFKQEHYYIQATYDKDTDFSISLKRTKGGHRTGGQWWQFLDVPYYDIPEGKFSERFKFDKKLQQYVIDNVEKLKNIVNRHHRTVTWKEKINKCDNWKISIWKWDTLVCEYDNAGEGNPFMDIVEKDSTGIVLIQLDNRQNNTEKLRHTLKRIGCDDKVPQTNGYVILEEFASVEAERVAERVNSWIEKIIDKRI